MRHPHFPVRPTPEANESFIGYCLRLAKVNGRLHIKELNKVLGIAFSQYQFCVGHKKFETYLERLAPKLLREVDKLREHFSEYQNLTLVNSKKRMVQSLSCYQPKVCIHCLSGGKVLQTDWQYLHNTHCDVHQVLLTDVCPSCGEQFDWTTSLLEGCTSCGVAWSDCRLAHSSTPVYQTTLDEAIKGENQPLLEVFYAVFAVTLRPNDYVINQQNKLSLTNKETHQKHLQAYGLIHSPLYARQWAKEYEKAGHLTPFLHGVPLLHYIKQARESFCIPVESNHCYSHDRVEHVSAIRPYRQKLAKRVPLSRQVGLLEAATFLGIDVAGFGSLLNQEIIEPIHESYFQTDTLFDLESLIEVDLVVWGKSKQSQNCDIEIENALTPVMDLFHSLEAFCLSPAMLIAICLKEPEIPLYSAGGAHWYELKVIKSEFLQWLEGIYLKHIPDEISVADFRRMTGTDERQCRELVRNTSLSFKPWVKSDVISRASLRRFLESHTLLGRLIKLYELDRNQVLPWLETQKIEPAYLSKNGAMATVYSSDILNMQKFHDLFGRNFNSYKIA